MCAATSSHEWNVFLLFVHYTSFFPEYQVKNRKNTVKKAGNFSSKLGTIHNSRFIEMQGAHQSHPDFRYTARISRW